jgi:hypothetical protein
VLGIFRNNNPLAIILLFILGYASIFLKPDPLFQNTIIENGILADVLMNILRPLEKNPSTSIKIISYTLLMAEAFYLNKISRDYKLLEKGTFIVAMAFLLMNFLIPTKISLFMLLINGLLLFVFSAFIAMYKKSNPLNDLLIAGFITASISAVINNYFILYLWLTVALLIMRPTSLREWSVLNIGFILPFYFLISVLYLTDKLSFDAILHFNKPEFAIPKLATIQSIKLIMLIILPLIGLSAGAGQINKMVLQNRKAYIIMFALFLGAVIINLLNINNIGEYAYLLLLPATILLSPFFQSFKKDFIPNLVLIVLIVLSYIR